MKLVLIKMIIFLTAADAFAAGENPGAYAKLRAMFESAKTPASIQQVYAALPKVKQCVASDQSAQDLLTFLPAPDQVTYTTPSYGPSFPAETFNGISFGMNWAPAEEFFNHYSEKLTSYGLELNTTVYLRQRVCDDEGYCGNQMTKAPFKAQLRLTAHTIVMELKSGYAYCWQ